jgi:hypothetical protein
MEGLGDFNHVPGGTLAMPIRAGVKCSPSYWVFAIFSAKIFRPSNEKGSAQKGAKITKAWLLVM